jgi:fructose-1-phosphate kinase PfkB-like protein
MYEYEIDGTFELECEMREVSFVLAERVLEECTKSTSLDALVDLIKNELQGVTPSREELHILVKKYYGDEEDIVQVIKSVECEICFKRIFSHVI